MSDNYPSSAELTIRKLQRDNEALRKENDKLKATNARAVIHHIESICEVCAHCMGEDGCANCINKQLAAAEAKCEGLKSAAARFVVATQRYPIGSNEQLDSYKDWTVIASEPPSTSLTNYIREQTDDIADFVYDVDAMVKTNHQSLSYPQSEYHRKALAKLKEIRGEK